MNYLSGFGLEKIRKSLVYTISWCICKLHKYVARTHRHGVAVRPCGVHRSHFLIFSRPKPGGSGVYIYIYKYIYGVPMT